MNRNKATGLLRCSGNKGACWPVWQPEFESLCGMKACSYKMSSGHCTTVQASKQACSIFVGFNSITLTTLTLININQKFWPNQHQDHTCCLVTFPFMGTVSPWNATLSQLFLTIFQGDFEVHPHLSTVLKSCFKGALKPPHANSCAGWMHSLCARKWEWHEFTSLQWWQLSP